VFHRIKHQITSPVNSSATDQARLSSTNSRENATLSTRLHPFGDVDFALRQAFRGVLVEVLYAERVDSMSLVCLRVSFSVEHVSEVAPAVGTHHFQASHVFSDLHVTFSLRRMIALVESTPSAIWKFRLGRVQRVSTSSAAKISGFREDAVVFAASAPLRPLLPQNLIFLLRQLLLPFRVGFLNRVPYPDSLASLSANLRIGFPRLRTRFRGPLLRYSLLFLFYRAAPRFLGRLLHWGLPVPAASKQLVSAVATLLR